MAALNRDFIVGTLAGALVASGVTAAILKYLPQLTSKSENSATDASTSSASLSTTSSAHSSAVYEDAKAVAEYLLFHFGKPADILPYKIGPHDALDFASRLANAHSSLGSLMRPHLRECVQNGKPLCAMV